MTKKILIIDDEVLLAETVLFFLKSKGYGGEFCTSPKEAAQIYLAGNYDLIICDIQMPLQSGIELFVELKPEIEKRKTSFVLMTGNVDAISMQKAYDLGVDEFILKPFDVADLKIVMDLVLQQSQSEDGLENFYHVPVSEYILSSANNFDIYLNIENKFMCLAKKGQELSNPRLQNYQKKGLKDIYLTDKDYAKYTDTPCAVALQAHTQPIEKLKKLKLYTNLLKAVTTSGVSHFLDLELSKKALLSFENYSQISTKNDEIFKILESMNSSKINLIDHAAKVSFLSTAIAIYWKWTHPKILSKIAMAALLCESGLRHMPELIAKKRMDFSAEDIKAFESYPQNTLTELSNIKNIPDEVLKVALQHHENEVGLGFPEHLTKDKLHPYSRLIHGVCEFYEYSEELNSKEDIKKAVQQVYSFHRKTVSEQVMKSFFVIFDLPVPKDLTNVLLPFQTARMT